MATTQTPRLTNTEKAPKPFERNAVMNTHPRRKRGLLTGLVAAAIALTMAFSATPAQADGPAIDPGTSGSIRIHKFEQPAAVGDQGTGLPNSGATAGLTPLAGVVFTAQRVNSVDLTTNAGWEAAGNMTIAEAAQNLTVPGFPSTATDTEGNGLINNLPIGLYYVKETTFPNNVTPTTPFLVTIPMTHPTELNTWLYDVDVYPKNSTTDATKTLEDKTTFAIGNNIEWTILGAIPKVQAIDRYTIVDDLDPKLQFVGAEVTLTGTSGVVLAPADYTVTPAPGDPVEVVFTPAGFLKLRAASNADTNAKVKVVITTKVLAAGEIANAATLFPNDRSFGRTTAPVDTKFGTIVLEKAGSVDKKVLPGAQFQVFLTEEDAKAKTASAAISINGVSTFTSRAEDGKVVIEGLRYSGWANGGPVTTAAQGYQAYWIAETKAPVGFELLAAPIKVVVDSVSDTVVTQQVLNVPKNAGFQLPLTGASGASAIIMIAGVLLLVVGTIAVVVSRRKRNQVKA